MAQKSPENGSEKRRPGRQRDEVRRGHPCVGHLVDRSARRLTPAWPPTARLRKQRRGSSPRSGAAPSLGTIALPDALPPAAPDSVAGQRSKTLAKSGPLQCCGISGGRGIWTAGAGSPTHRHFLDTGGRGASGIAIALINSTHTRARGSWWLIEACWRALILRTLGDRWTSYCGVSLITDRIHARL
jgi:hypothetical protein